jgi:alkylhydroperoxidase family enzyme
VLLDVDTCRLEPREKALLRFIEQVNEASMMISPSDIAALHAHGWTDEAIYHAITVCALFNFYNRWVDATGVHAMSDGDHYEGAVRTARGGYFRRSL